MAGTGLTLTLSGTNTYGGGTTISAGTLKAGISTALPSTTSVSDAGTLDLGGNSISIGSLNGGGSITTSGASGTNTLTVSGGGSFSGTISNGSTANVAMTVAGSTLTLSGTNSYTAARASTRARYRSMAITAWATTQQALPAPSFSAAARWPSALM